MGADGREDERRTSFMVEQQHAHLDRDGVGPTRWLAHP